MAKSKKSKWVLGLTGTALSAFVISQIGPNQADNSLQLIEPAAAKTMSKQEKEYVQLDWSNYEINGTPGWEGSGQSDRQTRRT